MLFRDFLPASFFQSDMSFQSQPKGFGKWQWPLVLLALATGFSLRAAFILRGHPAFNSDELFYYHSIQSFERGSDGPDLLGWHWNIRFWIVYGFYLLCGHQMGAIDFIAGLINALTYLLWAYVLVRRTGSRAAAIPLLVFLVFPAPCVSYLGTLLCEFRSSSFYGAILILFAGNWFKDSKGSLAFAFLSALGCWEDLFTVFFVLPVFWYEKRYWLAGPFVDRLKRVFLVGLWLAGMAWVVLPSSHWARQYNNGYIHPGIGSPGQWAGHFRLLTQAWPLYWAGILPWGYLQNSQLGLFLSPPAAAWTHLVIPAVFWPLLVLSLAGSFFFFSGKKCWNEAFLWLAPFALFLFFFIFGSQSWDVLTFRYLGLFQIFPGILTGLFAAFLDRPLKNVYLLALIAVWIIFHGVMLSRTWMGNSPEHPAQHIAYRLEQMGVTAGFANYWVSEPVRYFSKNEVLLTPYDQPALSGQAEMAAQTSERIALVWLEGLDHPGLWDEVVRQIQSLHYHPVLKRVFAEEGWSVFIWQKNKPL
jgi:hypothetical protein